MMYATTGTRIAAVNSREVRSLRCFFVEGSASGVGGRGWIGSPPVREAADLDEASSGGESGFWALTAPH
jgi:hypothetical protein